METSRETDLVARLGGDEFLVLLADLQLIASAGNGSDSSENAQSAVETVAMRIHDALSEPFVVSDAELSISTSIGISIFPLDAEDSRTLLKNADAAMYQSKNGGPGRYILFGAGTWGTHSKLALVTRLRKAVDEQQWVLHYQPVVDLVTGEILGVEALLRWRDPDDGLVPPRDFVHLAEELGLIESIGEWLYTEVFRQVTEWRRDGVKVGISFNLSVRQLWHPEFSERLLARVAAADVDPAALLIEITESAAMTDPGRTNAILTTLQARGLRFAIDDFGTGFSSLARLRELPVDVLKIDSSFVRDAPGDRDAANLLRAAIQLALGLGKSPLAEGIESDEQRRFLVEAGCHIGQGYFFGEPVEADEVPALVRRGFRTHLGASA